MALARKTFGYSIQYLAALFALLLAHAAYGAFATGSRRYRASSSGQLLM